MRAQFGLPAGWSRSRGIESVRCQPIGDMRRPGNSIEPVPVLGSAAIDETGGRLFKLGIDDDELAPIATRGESRLRVITHRDERQREIEHARGAPRRDQAEDGIGAIGEAGDIPPVYAAEYLPRNRIDCKRAGKVSDDLVVGAAIKLREPAIDEHAGHCRVEDAKTTAIPGRSAPSDTGVYESSREEEVLAKKG